MKRSAENDIDELSAPANAQKWDLVPDRPLDPFDFEPVTFQIELDLGLEVTAVVIRADVIATANDQPIQPFSAGPMP